MTDRVKMIYQDIMDNYYHIPMTIEKMRYMTDSFKRHHGYNDTLMHAYAYADYLDKRSIYIDEGQLLVGNFGAKPHAAEYDTTAPLWPEEDFKNILAGGIEITEEDHKELRALDSYWKGTGRMYTEKECYYYDTDDRLWDYRRRGMQMPPFTNRNEGFSCYMLGRGWFSGHPIGLTSPDYSMHLYTGYQAFIDEAKKRKSEVRFRGFEDTDRYEFYDAMIIVMEATIRHAERLADLCDQKAAEVEASDPKRAAELREMARINRKVPRYGAETFWEGLQAINYYFLQFADGSTPLQRMDKMLWPMLEKDLESGRLTRDQAMELIQCFRLKIFDFTHVEGNPDQREKWAGRARWNNIILGGCDRDGNDVTNPLTYMFIEAAKDLKIPHPTMTIRVTEKTPKELMVAALDCVRETGMGYPAFISEKEYVDYIVEHTHGKVDEAEARDFTLHGCVDVGLPGRSRQTGVPMIPMTVIMEIAIDGGEDKMMGTKWAEPCKKLSECTSYEEFYNECLMKEVRKTLDMGHECCMIRFAATRQHSEDPIKSAFYHGALDVCKDLNFREMKFEGSLGVNLVGMVTTIDSLAAIKYICFDKKLATPQQMYDALRANWEGYEDLRQLCLQAPKYGNDDDYVDSIGEKLWDDIKAESRKYKGPFGNEMQLSAVSITTHGPAGRLTGATANGRFAGTVLSDGSASPSQGCDVNGPTACMKSAMRMAHGWSATLHNMKFDKSALRTEKDLEKLGMLVQTYLTNGGHHIQFNVVSQEVLEDALEHPKDHEDLVVRVAGYSTFFTQLTPAMQVDVVNRTLLEQV